jgi:hypothetical protein
VGIEVRKLEWFFDGNPGWIGGGGGGGGRGGGLEVGFSGGKLRVQFTTFF